jgi:ABC-2 type transport system ATP-binding protein
VTNALETRNLGRRFGRAWALRDCTLQLPRGAVAALVGPSGAGKSTLLHLAVGILQATEGSVSILGESMRGQHPETLARIGFVAQDAPLSRNFSVADMLRFGEHLNPRWDNATARRRLARLNIPLDRQCGRLSGGQQAQVALAMAAAKRPEVLFLDEPLARGPHRIPLRARRLRLRGTDAIRVFPSRPLARGGVRNPAAPDRAGHGGDAGAVHGHPAPP